MTPGDNATMDRLRRLLDLVIREARWTYADVERRLGWARSTCNRLVQGVREIRVEQLLAILDLVGMRASTFFGIAERFEKLDVTLELRSAILRGLSKEDDGLDDSHELSDEELQSRIAIALRKMLKETPKE